MGYPRRGGRRGVMLYDHAAASHPQGIRDMDHPVVQIAMRVLHIVSAVAAVGGIVFQLVCLIPSMRLIDDTLATTILRLNQRRFHRLLYAAIAGLLVSGVYNWWLSTPRYEAIGPSALALIAGKSALALVLFAIVAGRSIGLIVGRPRLWLWINLLLALAVLTLGATLRYVRM